MHPSRLTDGAAPDWLDRQGHVLLDGIDDADAPVPLGHVLWASRQLKLSIGETAQRLETLGLKPPHLPASLSMDDIALLSVDLKGAAPWLDSTRPVGLHHLIKAHAVLNKAPFWSAERLAQLGFAVQCEDMPSYPEYRDVQLLRAPGPNSAFLRPDEPVPLAHLITMGRRLGMPIRDVADRLRELGMTVPDLATTIRGALARVPLAE